MLTLLDNDLPIKAEMILQMLPTNLSEFVGQDFYTNGCLYNMKKL